ncbi:hypothetical protein COU88_00320 [Candidatus Roizmanbacteria bacterium CG10_big_fil_rev_8_21_14_0_10_39_6]|uniref:ArsR family transcriptional regulator n=1 Tax=Candidatus Roizmanbacteria bacterium CG10_big_fil_rev_8_21_14_0_10_39_6 TaxID=1974853 RepID=A0A2M8KTR9_9BACT|nr:MAG: hypothetical protein COU88_00320 [Candidatus Roizmanbacteria bacterium CG10_big_fil_rev_8_21_14_0_10_39_6]
MYDIPFFSKTKSKILLLLYENPHERYHMRHIERLTKERINSVREALEYLVKKKIATMEAVGRKRFFQSNKHGLFYDELLRMTAKKTGLGGRILTEKPRLGKVRFAFLTAFFYRQSRRKENEIDLCVVGSVSMKEISRIAQEEGARRNIEINYSVMNYEEFTFRKKNKDPFLFSLLEKPRLMLVGSEEDLLISKSEQVSAEKESAQRV